MDRSEARVEAVRRRALDAADGEGGRGSGVLGGCGGGAQPRRATEGSVGGRLSAEVKMKWVADPDGGSASAKAGAGTGYGCGRASQALPGIVVII